MTNRQNLEALTQWDGDTGSLIAEMKRRAGVTTDQNLAKHLGIAQSTLSWWRRRDRIPEAAVLRAERVLQAGGDVVTSRMLAARMIVLRLPEFWYIKAAASGLKARRAIIYRRVAFDFIAIVEAVYEQLGDFERESGETASNLAPQLLDDESFMLNLIEIAKVLPGDGATVRPWELAPSRLYD